MYQEEEESLDIGKFTVTGSTDVCKIERKRQSFLDMPAIKLTFSAYGNISIEAVHWDHWKPVIIRYR